MNRKQRLFFALLTGVLLSFGWFRYATGPVLLIALVPLLFVEDYFFRNRERYSSIHVFWYALLSFSIWNGINIWWIWNASAIGMVLAILINGSFLALVFLLAHLVRCTAGTKPGFFALIVFWLFWEYFYLNGEISFPWLTLGNGFANNIRLVQWYEYTGVFGGSLWVLVSNILVFGLVQAFIEKKSWKSNPWLSGIVILWIILPVICSLLLYSSYRENHDPYRMVVIQPNIDPYEKFVAIPSEEQTRILLDLAGKQADDSVDYFIAPETALNNDILIDHMHGNAAIDSVVRFMKNWPKAKYVVGIIGFREYGPGDQLTPTARPLGNSGYYYDSYNSAIQIDSTPEIQYYHKSKLVVGVEKMPYPQYLGFLKKLTLRLGGTFRSHAIQKYRSVLRSPQDSMGVATVICYESIFGEFVTDYLKKDAGFIFIITNDGWWGDTPGYRQHFSFARIRAVECRRSIVRSANTGISGFINQRGDVLDSAGWWVRTSLKADLNANRELTYYTRHGDYIARLASWFALLTGLYALVLRLMKKPAGR
jgi:apolipoprotein N-acyltransferase